MIAEPLKCLSERLNAIGMLYADRDAVAAADLLFVPHEISRVVGQRQFANHRHKKNSMAMVLMTTSSRVGRRRPLRHFRCPSDAHPQPWRWAIDPLGFGGGLLSTSTPVAEAIARKVGGGASLGMPNGPEPSARTRLWFTDIASALWACSWPWVAEWGASDLYLALTSDDPMEIAADWLCEQGLKLGEALMLWRQVSDVKNIEFRARADAAIAVYQAAAPLRAAEAKLIDCDGHDYARWTEKFRAWDRHVDGQPNGADVPGAPKQIASAETLAALEQLLAIGRGCPHASVKAREAEAGNRRRRKAVEPA